MYLYIVEKLTVPGRVLLCFHELKIFNCADVWSLYLTENFNYLIFGNLISLSICKKVPSPNAESIFMKNRDILSVPWPMSTILTKYLSFKASKRQFKVSILEVTGKFFINHNIRDS